MIKEHKTRNTNICIDGCSFIDRNEIEKNPQIIEDAAPAMKQLALEFNYFEAIIEISTFTFFGKPNTATVSRAGKSPSKYV